MIDYSVVIFLIVMGLLLAAMFLGLGICLGREYERTSKKYNRCGVHSEDSDNTVLRDGSGSSV